MAAMRFEFLRKLDFFQIRLVTQSVTRRVVVPMRFALDLDLEFQEPFDLKF